MKSISTIYSTWPTLHTILVLKLRAPIRTCSLNLKLDILGGPGKPYPGPIFLCIEAWHVFASTLIDGMHEEGHKEPLPRRV